LPCSSGGHCFPLGQPPLTTWRVAGGRWQLDIWGITGTVEADILRRDFTVNALFFRLPRGPLIDLVGGLDDLAAGRIQVISEQNLHDDPLRVLRALRLVSTRPELRLTAASERLLAATCQLLPRVARERIIEELRLLLAGAGVERALASGSRLGILTALVPAWVPCDSTIAAARAARVLARLRARGGALASGAELIAPAIVAAPAAGFPSSWDQEAAARTLVAVGYPQRPAGRIAAAVSHGERLATLPSLDSPVAFELSVEAADLLPAALAWSIARDGQPTDARLGAATSLIAWARRFGRRSTLLDGNDIAEVLQLPAGPERRRAAHLLRLAQARGEVHTRHDARAFLLRRYSLNGGNVA
jgi:hypothetical protein